jgi:ketose-bisphosphate aldolase
MLVDGRAVLQWAEERDGAAASFNTYNLETTKAIIAAAEAEDAPIFLAVGSGALRYAGFDMLGGMVTVAAARAAVPVALHLDHADSLELVQRAAGAGFSSFMVDGSALPLEANIALLQAARSLVSGALEAELGGVGGAEDRSGDQHSAVPMTDPAEAARLVTATGVDSLAVAIGNAHGLYRGEPRLDLDRLRSLRAAVTVPLVLHGASGIPDGTIVDCIGHGVRKINVNTELRRAWFEALRRGLALDEGFDLPALLTPAMAAVQATAQEMIRLFRR